MNTVDFALHLGILNQYGSYDRKLQNFVPYMGNLMSLVEHYMTGHGDWGNFARKQHLEGTAAYGEG